MSTISFTWSFICLTTPFSFNEKLAEKLVKIKVPVWFVILLGVPCTMKFNFKSILCLHHIFSYTIEGSWTIKKPRWLEVMRVLKGMKWKLTTESTNPEVRAALDLVQHCSILVHGTNSRMRWSKVKSLGEFQPGTCCQFKAKLHFMMNLQLMKC